MKAPVVIIGVGALGSHLALFARNWNHPLRVVDFDHIETKNVLSQFHSKMGMGKNKAQGIQQALQGLFGIKVEAIPHRLTEDNSKVLLGGAALVIDCTDNGAARRCIKAFVRKNNIPCLHGCLSADGQFAQVIWDEIFEEDDEGTPGQATCEDGANLPFHALAAAQLAVVAQMFLSTGTRRSLMLLPDKTVRLA